MTKEKNRHPFGKMPDGREVELLSLTHGALSCEIVTYGGAVRSLRIPDRNGNPIDVALGLESLQAYREQDKFLGALVGRYANRIGGARFSLEGREYCLTANDGANHLHGGAVGYDKRVWMTADLTDDTAVLSLFSAGGQEGYPGGMMLKVTYQLTDDSLEIDYLAQSSEDTICNLTNHTYFNLSGHDSGSILDHLIQIPADAYTPVDSQLIPTGEIASVSGTPMDFREAQPIGANIDAPFAQIRFAGGYDHNWVLDGPTGEQKTAARVCSPRTGIIMEVLTTMPGVQFYSGNFLDGCPTGKGGAQYAARSGFCLETQYFPDSPNHPNFPSPVLRKGENYRQKTVYRFTVEQ